MKRTAFLITASFVIVVLLLPFGHTQTLKTHNLDQRSAIVNVTVQPLRWASVLHVSAAATTTTTSAPPVTDATSTNTADWECIRVHESGDRYNDPTAPSGAYGIEFTSSVPTWQSLGYGGAPWQGTPAQQDAAALILYHRYGWTPWSSRFACGL